MNPKDEPRRAIGSPRSLSLDADMGPLGNRRIFAFFSASDKAGAVPQSYCGKAGAVKPYFARMRWPSAERINIANR
jgi:hypothetical protein